MADPVSPTHDSPSIPLSEFATSWTQQLVLNSSSPRTEEAEVLAIPLDEPNQRVIKYDCDRTRATFDSFKLQSTRDAMERVLTLYCKQRSVKFKQGMNEVLAPFVYLKLSGETCVTTWGHVFDLFTGFVSVFLSNMFDDDEFHFLQRSCTLFRSLLRYHAPALSSRLDSANVTPEIYVTPWFLTQFSSKTSMPAVLSLWNLLISKGDRFSFIFLSVSQCLAHARQLRASAKSSLPETITRITITEDAVGATWKRAMKIRHHTPPYFTQQILNAAETGEIESLACPHLEKQLGEVYPMLLRPMDLFRSSAEWKYVVLDCRPPHVVSSGAMVGSLPLSVPFDLESLVAGQSVFPVAEALKKVASLLSVDASESIPQWPIDSHICIMGLSDSVIDATGLLFLALAKFSSVPRVSLLLGGFHAVHNEAPQELIDHDPQFCPICNGVPIDVVADMPLRLRAGSSASESSSVSSPVSHNSGIMQRFKSFVTDSSSVVATTTSSFLSASGSRFIGGGSPPIPTSRAIFVPSPDQLVHKCKLVEVLARPPGSDLEAHALIIVSQGYIKCFAAPLDMTLLTEKCELRLYGSWKLTDVCKITTRNNQPATLLMYFSVETGPDLVISLITAELAKTLVEEIRSRYRQAKRPPH